MSHRLVAVLGARRGHDGPRWYARTGEGRPDRAAVPIEMAGQKPAVPPGGPSVPPAQVRSLMARLGRLKSLDEVDDAGTETIPERSFLTVSDGRKVTWANPPGAIVRRPGGALRRSFPTWWTGGVAGRGKGRHPTRVRNSATGGGQSRLVLARV